MLAQIGTAVGDILAATKASEFCLPELEISQFALNLFGQKVGVQSEPGQSAVPQRFPPLFRRHGRPDTLEQ